MRRILGLLTAFVLLTAGIGGAAAEGQKAPDYILEGFDGESTSRNWETNQFFSRMEEQTGISFQFREYTSAKNWQERKTEILRAENLPDVLFKAELNPEDVRDMYEAGVLIDLKPYLEEYAPDLWKLLADDPEVLASVSMPDGAIPALPNFNTLEYNDAMWINTAWLKRLKLETPRNAAELKEVLTAFRDGDPNNNGKKDEVPLTFIGMWELRFMGHAFGITDNDYYVSAKEGKVTSSLTTDNNREFLAWLHELWEEQLLDHNGFATVDSLRQITDENAVIPYGIIMSSSPLTVVPSAALGNYSVLMPLEYGGEQKYRSIGGEVIRGTFAVTSRCGEPEKLVSWVNLLYTEEVSRMSQFGQEGKEYSYREDGKWEWNDDMTTVSEVILPERTISSGTAAPGVTPTEFQLDYSDESVVKDIRELLELKQYSVYPYPQVTLNREDEAEIARIQAELAPYAEKAMACFVTGDIPLDDEQWALFCKTVEEKGLNRMVEIWQKYVQ